MAVSQARAAERYLDAPCSRRQALNAIEQLLAQHIEDYHTPLHTRAWRKVTMAARRFKFRLNEARNA